MKNYNDLLQHARGVQETQAKLGLSAEEESKFIDCTQTMDILENREKGELASAAKSALIAEAIGTGVVAGSALLATGNVSDMLSVLGIGAVTAATTVGYKAIKNYLLSKKYSKEREALAEEYQMYLDSREEPELSK